jgi:hypothetical protein
MVSFDILDGLEIAPETHRPGLTKDPLIDRFFLNF